MLTLVYGNCGSPKSEYVYSLALENLLSKGRSLLIVPEQSALSAEDRIYKLAGDKSTLGLEVLNFQRLAEAVFRKCGCLAYNYINGSAKKLLVSKAVTELSPALGEYGRMADDPGFVSGMLSQITEFKHARITPSAIARAADSIEKNDKSSFVGRLNDISLIYTAYNTLVSESYDDPDDDLTKCARLIAENNPLSGAGIYFDSFNGFTEQQYAIISSLLKCGCSVTVSLCLPGDECRNVTENEIYAVPYETERRLINIAEKYSVSLIKKSVAGSSRFNCSQLKYLSEYFSLSGIGVRAVSAGGSIRAVSCRDIFDECETVSALIAKDIRSGFRYRDIAIITRDTDRYKGIIDAVLERNNLPVYFSSKTDISEKALVRFILTAFAICGPKTKCADIIAHIRCGLTNLSLYECDLLESYALTWKINGKAWWNADGFKMNPRGYTPLTPKDSETLGKINDIRERLMTCLEGFREKIKKCKTVRDFSVSVVEYLNDCGIAEKLAARSAAMKNRGENVLAAEEAGIWSALCSALDVLCAAVGSDECSTDKFIKLFKLVLSDTEIGTIPQTNDVITVGDASLLRADAAKSVYLIGCEDGSFPQKISEPSLLTYKDREALAACSLESLCRDPAYDASEELFWFYLAACSASDRLTLTYSRLSESAEEKSPSYAFSRICGMFDGALCDSSDIGFEERITSPESLMEYSAFLKSGGYGEALGSLCEKHGVDEKIFDCSSIKICNKNEKISDSVIKKIFPGNLSISQTATDAYANCPFAFQCKYSLKLSQSGSADIERNDLGTLIHSVLRTFLEEANEKSLLKSEALTPETIRDAIEKITSEKSSLLLEFTDDDKKARVSHMLRRIAEITSFTAANLAEEFRQSGFSPTFFEFPINAKSSGALMPVKLSLDDGSYIELGGIADRVDTMYKNGKLYVRVADYKTGKKAFSLENIHCGLSLQLLIYLFSIWENADSAFKVAAGAPENSNVLPAGAEYVMTTPELINAGAGTDRDILLEWLSDSFSRSGIYLADREILGEMDSGFSEKYIPVKSDLTAHGKSVLASIDEMNSLKNEVSAILINIGNGIKHGNAEAKPLPENPGEGRNYSACKYCKMRPVCKYTESRDGTDTETT